MFTLLVCNFSTLVITIYLTVSQAAPSHQQMIYILRGIVCFISLLPIGLWQHNVTVLCTWVLFGIQSIIFILQQAGIFMQDEPLESIIYVNVFASIVLNGVIQKIKKTIESDRQMTVGVPENHIVVNTVVQYVQ